MKPDLLLAFSFCSIYIFINFIRVAEFYERSIPCLGRQIELVPATQKNKLVQNLNMARKFLLQVYNGLLHSVSLKPLLVER